MSPEGSWPEISPRTKLSYCHGGNIVYGRIRAWAFCLPKQTLPHTSPMYPTSQWLFVEVQMIRRLPYMQMPRQQIPPHFLIDLHLDAAGAGIA